MRDTSQALNGKMKMAMTSGGSIMAKATRAQTIAATRHCSHWSIASSTAASTHSIQ